MLIQLWNLVFQRIKKDILGICVWSRRKSWNRTGPMTPYPWAENVHNWCARYFMWYLGGKSNKEKYFGEGGWTNLEWYHGGETHMSVDTFLEGVLTLADTMGNKENFLFNCNCLRKIAITCILGITCFRNPFPRSGKYPKHVSPLK